MLFNDEYRVIVYNHNDISRRTKIERLGGMFESSRAIIVEGDSSDNTLSILR